MIDNWKPSSKQVQAAYGKTVPDLITPGLKILFSGINPSLYSAAVGHHFARPGNRFWPALHAAGFTPRLFSPFEDQLLLNLGYGITNLVERSTPSADELSPKEFVEGGRRLEAKLRRYRPTLVAFLGITAYRSAYNRPRASMGRQPELISGSILWVLPNPSGLNAHYQLANLARLYSELRRAGEIQPGPPQPGGESEGVLSFIS
jgi:TDG/mug DNA glycosylase family protein